MKIYQCEPQQQSPPRTVNGLLTAYATTFFLTISNPVTILSFVAIYAGWHVESLAGNYLAAAILTCGVFAGSALWWVALFIGLTTFRDKFSLRILGWIHRVSGALIAGFGVVVLLSLSPLKTLLRINF
jgi:threonine/homoserine/homoserine lactone efflux protein